MSKSNHLFMAFLTLIHINIAYAPDHFLSFVMPCYNCAKTIRHAVDSIYKQNLPIPFEVVCTDDGSTDNTLDILNEYAAKYKNFHVIVHEKNLGGGAANNTCVFHAKGDLLFRLDSDNILAPNSVTLLVEALDLSGCDGAAFQEQRFFGANTKFSWFYKPVDNLCDLAHALSLAQNPFHSGNYLYTRKSFERAGGYPTKRSGTDTTSFGLKQYMTGTKIVVVPNTMYWHYYNPEGYYMRESKTDRNNRVVWETLQEYTEVFDQETRVFLANVNPTIDPWQEIQKGHIKLVSSEALEQLFKGYHHEENNRIPEAIEAYKNAIKYGCNTQKITQRLDKLIKYISN